MKRKTHITLVFLVFIAFQNMNAQNKKNKSKGQVSSKQIEIKTKTTLNEARKFTATAKISDDDLDCIIDLNTGKCIDPDNPIDPDSGLGNTTEVGSIAGSLSISLTGAASYSIPIMLPAGIKDVAPNIGISYTSQGANGLAGWGWNISGLSTISRIPATKYYDNKHDGIDFKDDRYSIDGQRLILKSGTYGANGSEYQTENYSNIKVIAFGTHNYGSSYGPSYFIVFYPNGTRAWYGNAGNSRSPLEWAIHRWQDAQGNYVDYDYQFDNGGLLSIKTIKYGGRVGGTSPMNQVNFTYGTRIRPESLYIGELYFKRTHLLMNIQITTSGSQYRKYELSHSATSLGYQRLTSVKEFNAEDKALSPITFSYDNTSSWVNNRVESDYLNFFRKETSTLLAGDYVGDGRTDVLIYDTKNPNINDRIYIYSNLYEQNATRDIIFTDGFTEAFPSNILSNDNKILNKQAITTVKETFNNSSSATIRFRTYIKDYSDVRYEYDKFWNAPTYFYEQTQNQCNTTNGVINTYTNVLSGQTSNISVDVINASNTIETNATYSANRVNLKPGFQAKAGSNFKAISSSDLKIIPNTYVSGDFNGDGLTDVLAISEKYYTRSCYEQEDYYGDIDCICETNAVSGNSKVYFIDLKRTSNSPPIQIGSLTSSIEKSTDKILVADHNGDGKQDIYHFQEGKLSIYSLDDNNNLITIHNETDSGIKLDYPILLGDYNGDGKTDFLMATLDKSSYWRYFISKGKSFYKNSEILPFAYYKDERIRGSINENGVTIQNPLYEYRYTAQDVNGDGKTDLIMHNVISSQYQQQGQEKPSVEYLSIYKNTQSHSSYTPTISYETGYTKNNGGVDVSGWPIFLESNRTNGNLEYGYLSNNKIFMYEFAKDHRQESILKSVTNNGVINRIDYERLGLEDQNGNEIYTSDDSQTYPFININRANSFQLVKKITENSAGIIRYQDFKYHGAISNIDIGFQGFLKTKRSNWYGNGVGTLWTISKYDPTRKGILEEKIISTSPHEGNSYMSKTTNTYTTLLASNKVFTNIPTNILMQDALSGVTTNKTITYDIYKNPLTEYTTYNEGSENIRYTYSNNSSVNSQLYHVGRLTKKIETNTIGGNTFTTEEEYTYNNNLLSQQKVKGDGTAWNTQSFLYDSYGNVTGKTLSPSGLSSRTENFKYDTSGRFLTESADIEGLKTKFTYDTFGNPLTSTNPYNQVSTFTYDGWNRLVSEENYLNKITTFTCESISGGGIRKTSNYPQGTDEVNEYNALGWLIKAKVLGIGNKWILKSFEYDVAGRTIRESEPYFSSPSQWNSVTYDNYGREITRTSFNGLVANISYNGLETTVDDGTKTIKNTTDGIGNVVKIEDSGGTINYTYYGNGVMKSANYGSHVVSTEIDGWGRKSKLTDPSAGNYTYEYNSIGGLIKEITPKGSTTYTYDSFGKISTKVLEGEETNMNLSYSYDDSSKLLTSIQGTNSRTNENYSYSYIYDSQRRPYITREQNGKAFFEHQVSRDDYGRVKDEIYITTNNSNNINSTVKVKNIYEANSGILTEIQDFNTSNSLWKINEVNERGQTLRATLGNGMVKNRTYDTYGYLTNILDQTIGSSTKVALNLEYSFNAVRGNLNNRKNNGLNWTENFTYDNLDRLTNISGSVSRNQQYDDRGRISNNSEVGDYNYASAHSYRIQGVDLNTKGDLHYQNQPLQKIKYNAYKKPVSISVKDKAKVDFEYGILQNRSHSYYGGNEENKLDRRYQKHYSAVTPVEIEVDNQGNTKIITYIGGDAYSAPVTHIKQTAPGAANGFHYLHRDYLGSILAITDSNANIIEQRQFSAWGEVDKFITSNSELDFEHNTTLLNRGYTGHEHFMGVALIHMNGRMYDAKLGRFLSPDNYIQAPFSTQSFNRYGYVWNNPLKFNDQSGEFIFTAIIIGAAVGAYFGGVQASGSWNPLSWDWGSAATWGGVLGGAAFGGLSGGVGAYAAVAITPFITSAGGFIGGAVSGIISGGIGGGISGGFMSFTPGGSGDFWGGVLRGTFMGAAGGGLLGGTTGGFNSLFKGNSFWTGRDISPKVLSPKPSAVEVSHLKAKSVESVGNTETKGLDLKNLTKSDINFLKQQYEPKTNLDGGNAGATRKLFTPDDVIRSVKGDSFDIPAPGIKTTSSEILMNRRDFGNLVQDFKANYGTGIDIIKNGSKVGQTFNFGTTYGNSTGSIRMIDANTYRLYWSSQNVNYKFTINVFENIR